MADCDNDGLQEVYAGYQENSNGIGAWEWTGTGFEQAGITSPLGSGGVNYLRIRNMTGDAGLDMAIGTHNGVRYYQGSGSAPISWTQYSTGLRSNGLCTQIDVNDINNDGLLDIIVGQYGDGLYIFTQDAGGMSWTDRSSTLPPVEQTGRVLGLVTGDVNNDGNVDIVLNKRTNPSGLFLLLGNGGGGTGVDFQWTYLNNSWQNRPMGTFYQSHLVDIDMDGDLDLLTAKESTGLHLYLGNGAENPGNNFAWTEVLGKGLPTTDFYTGANYLDFDNDGDLDVAGCTYGNGMIVLENNLTLPHVPVARAGPDQTINLGDTIYLDGSNSRDQQDCPDGDDGGTILTYQWNISSQPADSTLVDDDLIPSDSVSSPSFIPTHSGNYYLTLAVKDTDDHWSVSEDQIKITVIGINNFPVAHAGINQTVHSGSLVTLDGSASTDMDEAIEMLTFDWNISAGNPSPVTLSEESSMSPTFMAPDITGDYRFTLAVRDSLGAWSSEDEVIISVELPTNVRPVADAGRDFSAYSNRTIFLNGRASHDPDGSIVTWDWNCSSHSSITISGVNSSDPWFQPNRTGQYIFTLTVRDDRGAWANEDGVVITVIEENRAPVANAGIDFTAYYDEMTRLNGSASIDKEGYILSWDWNCTSHTSVVLSENNSSLPSFTPGEVDTYIFSLRVMDDLGLWSNTDTVNVTVVERPINQVPIAHAGKDHTVKINTTVELYGNNSYDLDGEIVLWDWYCSSHPGLVFQDGNSRNPSFFAGEIGTYEIILKVFDDSGDGSIKDTVLITVVPEDTQIGNGFGNTAPVISLTSHRNVEVLTGISTISWTAADHDLDPLSFSIFLLDQEGVEIKTLVDGLPSESRTWDWNTALQPDGSYRLKLLVSDGTDNAQFISDTFEIHNEDAGTRENRSNYGKVVIWIGAIVLILIILVMLLILMRSRRNKRNEESKVSRDDENQDDEEYRWRDSGNKYGEASRRDYERVHPGRRERNSDESIDHSGWRDEGSTQYDDEIGWDDEWTDDGDWNDDGEWEDDYYEED